MKKGLLSCQIEGKFRDCYGQVKESESSLAPSIGTTLSPPALLKQSFRPIRISTIITFISH